MGAIYCGNKADLLSRSDFVTLAVCLTPETTGLIGATELALMKPTATLINISRGSFGDREPPHIWGLTFTNASFC